MASEYRQFLHDIGLELTETDLRSLKFLCKDTMGDAVSEKICGGLDFLNWLENQGNLSKTNLSELVKCLVAAKRTDLADRIRGRFPEGVQGDPPAGLPSLNSLHSPVVESGEDGHTYRLEECPRSESIAMLSSDSAEQRAAGRFKLPADTVADTSGDLEDIATPLVPHAYQTELQEKCIKAGNCIVYAPSGSGMGLVSALVATHYLKGSPCPKEFRIIFVVDQRDQIKRRKEQLEEWLKPRFHFLKTAGLSGEQATKNPLDELIGRCHLIVLTADVLWNHLTGKGHFTLIPISKVNLLIMDSCHHTRDKHTYNKIMGRYMDAKMNKQPVPLVLGLTSCIPTKISMDEKETFEHVQKLCANLDVNSVIEVADNVTEMMAFITAPENQDYTAPPQETDPFIDKIKQVMANIEINILNENSALGVVRRGTVGYDAWVNERSEGDEIKKFCARTLVQCSHALIINKDVTGRDAIQFLRKYLSDTWPFATDPQKKAVLNQLQLTIDFLEGTCQSTKLELLRGLLTQKFREMPRASCILFTQTPYSIDALIDWINNDADLQFLKPTRLTGTESPEEKRQIIGKLGGASRLLVSSPSAVRGLRVTNCHVFVRYGVRGEEISVCHTGTRGEDCDYSACSYVSKSDAESSKQKKKEQMVQHALKCLAGLSLETRRRQLESIQKREFRKKRKKRESTSDLNLSQLLLYCKKCKQYLCRGDGVKKLKGTHRVIQSWEFEEHASWPKKGTPPKKTFEVDGVRFVGKVTCKACSSQLGSVVMTDDHERYPCIKIDYLVYSYEESADNVKREFNKEMKTLLSDTIEDL